MNRELKFRVWDKERDRLSKPFGFGSFGVEWNDGDFPMPIEFGVFKNRLVFQQYTGLKDKNGREIYEGDIVKWGVMLYDIKYGVVQDRESDYFVYPTFYLNRNNVAETRFDKELEVIGNIFENKELLK